ncbi:MAG: hypothetical protein DRJ98_02300 [Thermoprotei archaeon]|nr:MAG: hypothetical protein DRJ98_02300 [Thermoprotei archaeon]
MIHMAALNLEKLIAHRHWVTVKVGSKSIRVCARCTGCIVGFFSLLFLTLHVNFEFFRALSPYLQLTVCLLLAMPAMVDWLTQTYGLRSSTNKLRIITGFLEGISVAFLSLAAIPFIIKMLTLLSIGGGAFTLGFLLNSKFKGGENDTATSFSSR